MILRQSIYTHARLSFSRSSGPGGQNVNKLNTKVTAFLPIDELSCLNEDETELIMVKLANKINEKRQLVVTSQNHRSQLKNRDEVYSKLYYLVSRALVKARKRKATGPSASAKNRRLLEKKRHGEKKALRRLPHDD